MKKQLYLFIIISTLNIISCNETGTAYEKVSEIKTVSERVHDLHKTIIEIKNIEDEDALVRKEPLYLEYEYPIRENESYVVSYQFDDVGCVKIKLDTYFNKETDAQKVTKAIIKDLEVNTTFNFQKIEIDFYRWEDTKSKISIILNIQHIERGTISLTIFNTHLPS